MSMTDRDRKILLALIPLTLIAAFWFLVYSPKKDEAATAQTALESAQADQQTAESQAASVSSAKKGFADDYTTIVRLGKAVPASVDMPSLIVQLDRAARGTHITFDQISTGERQSVSATAQATDTTTSTDAKSAPGKTAENAQNGVNSANATNQANANAANGTSTDPSATTTTSASLESIPLTFSFNGTYFDLADFFHRMKRFVKVAGDNGDIVVRGRLMTIDSFNFKASSKGFPYLTATVSSTVYLAPKAEGVSAGATPAGPSSSTPAASSTPSTSGGGSSTPSSSTTAPAATVK